MSFEYLGNAIGKQIQIERGGPDKLQGKLLAVKDDHLIVQTENGIVYVNSQHIKTISEPILCEVQEGTDETLCTPEPIVIDAGDLRDLLSQLTHKLVKINQGGPNSLEGVLLTLREDAVTIVHKMKDYVHYPLYHIKTITWVMNANKEEKKDENKEEKKDNK
jgi:hypothetical protein